MANKYTNECSMSLRIRKRKQKTQFHFIAFKMAIINNTRGKIFGEDAGNK
jgi:hypothetical protein